MLDGRELRRVRPDVTGSPVYLAEINDYLQGGMLTPRRGGARADGGRAGRHVPCPLAIAAARVGDRRRALVVLAARHHRDRPLARHDLGSADPDRCRHRLRDPGAQPRGGGGGARQGGPPDRRDGVQPRPAAVRRDAHRSGRRPRAAHLQGADDPRLRCPAGDRHSRCSWSSASCSRRRSSASASTPSAPRCVVHRWSSASWSSSADFHLASDSCSSSWRPCCSSAVSSPRVAPRSSPTRSSGSTRTARSSRTSRSSRPRPASRRRWASSSRRTTSTTRRSSTSSGSSRSTPRPARRWCRRRASSTRWARSS